MSSQHLAPATSLSLDGARVVLDGALAKAAEIGVPQCVAVVDAGGHLLAFGRMDGAKVLSTHSALAKAETAASSRAPSGGMDAELALRLSVATGGRLLNVRGGLPIEVDGRVVGAVGVGSGTQDQDVEVGQAGVAALLAVLAGG